MTYEFKKTRSTCRQSSASTSVREEVWETFSELAERTSLFYLPLNSCLSTGFSISPHCMIGRYFTCIWYFLSAGGCVTNWWDRRKTSTMSCCDPPKNTVPKAMLEFEQLGSRSAKQGWNQRSQDHRFQSWNRGLKRKIGAFYKGKCGTTGLPFHESNRILG